MCKVVCPECGHTFDSNAAYSLCEECGWEGATPYPPATLKFDRYGNLHMWEGIASSPFAMVNGRMHDSSGKYAQTVLVSMDDTQEIIRSLAPDEGEALEHGWPVTTNRCPDDYFAGE